MSNEFFKVGYVLVDFWETNSASVQVESGSLLLLGVCEVFCEFLDEHVPGELYVIFYRVQRINPCTHVSDPGGYLRSLDECEHDGYFAYG